jgi:FkbM family methyltransferase
MGFTYIWDMEGGAWDWVRLVGAGQCVYDIGANSGQSTLHLARAVGREGRVIAFEPVPSTFQRMARNVALNALSQVTPVCAAASNAEGDAEFEFNEQRSAQGRLIPLGQGNTRSNEFRAIKVKQLRLDSYGTQGWPPPSFMKIDVEGGAPAVLEGAQNLIATCRPTIYVELHSPDEQAAIRDLLKDHRYRATSLSGQIVEDPAAQWISPLLCRPA